MDRARYKLDRQRVDYRGICTHLADARCHADISRPYNRRISSMEDVIIIGDGPVGFINALCLAQAGVRVSAIEAEHHQLPAGGGVLLVSSRRFRAPGNAGTGRGRRRAQAGLHA